jgi:protein gp37
MADKSKIEWTDATWNPIRARNLKTGKIGWFCEHSTTGCINCYAEGMNKRLGTGLPFKPGHRADVEIFLDEKMLTAPLRWKKPRMIFVCSMTDLFADFVKDEWIDKMFAVMALCPQHTFQVLTKRAERMQKYMIAPERKRTIAECTMGISDLMARAAGTWKARLKLDHFSACFAGSGPFPNVWLGVSCERQQEADERTPYLWRTPAAVRFVSAEPLLAPIDFSAVPSWGKGIGVDWIIIGGESGPKHRPMAEAWAHSIIEQCKAAGIAVFMKQMAGKAPIPVDLMIRQFP